MTPRPLSDRDAALVRDLFARRARLPREATGDGPLVSAAFPADGLSADAIERLVGTGLFTRGSGGEIRSTVCWTRFDGQWYASDPPWGPESRVDDVPPPGWDPKILRAHLPERPHGRVLEICCGAGALGISLAGSAKGVVLADVNERAGAYAGVNATLHGSGKCAFVRSDLFKGLAGETFDLVLASPPYVPLPPGEVGGARSARYPLYMDGGASGTEILEPLLAGLPAALRDEGTGLVVFDLAHPRPDEWIAARTPARGVALRLAILGTTPAAEYAQAARDPTEAEARERHLAALGASGVHACVLSVRSRPGPSAFRVVKEGPSLVRRIGRKLRGALKGRKRRGS